METDNPRGNRTRSVTYSKIKRIVLSGLCCFEPRYVLILRLIPISLWSHWSVRVSFDVECYSEHIRNSQVKHHDQVSKELEHLSKFYMPENGGTHKEPMVVVDCHGQILLWYLPEVLSTARLVRVHSS